MNQSNQRKFHYIYKISRIDGKYYIGMHSTNNMDDGYFGSGTLLARSVKKYGIETHTKHILEFLPDRLSLRERERELVNEEILNDIMCLNLKLGGSGGSHGKESEVWKRSGYKEMLGPLQSAGVKRKWKDPIYREKISQAMKNLWKTQHQKDKMRGVKSFLGKSHSEESKSRIGKANSAHQSGAGNANFGKRWMTKDGKTMPVPKDDVQDFLNNGYRLGRK